MGAHHGLADFESLQLLAGHWAAAYNTRLALVSGDSSGSAASGGAAAAGGKAGAAADVQGGGAGACHDYTALLPERLRRPFMDGEAVDVSGRSNGRVQGKGRRSNERAKGATGKDCVVGMFEGGLAVHGEQSSHISTGSEVHRQ